MGNIEPITDLNPFPIFTLVVDYLIEKNMPVPKDLNHLPSGIYHQALNYLDEVESGVNDCIENYRREGKVA